MPRETGRQMHENRMLKVLDASVRACIPARPSQKALSHLLLPRCHKHLPSLSPAPQMLNHHAQLLCQPAHLPRCLPGCLCVNGRNHKLAELDSVGACLGLHGALRRCEYLQGATLWRCPACVKGSCCCCLAATLRGSLNLLSSLFCIASPLLQVSPNGWAGWASHGAR